MSSDRWVDEIAAFEQSDQISTLGKNPIVFAGSSTIRLWKTLEDDFAQCSVLNRGFGGARIKDVCHFFDRIITRYNPKQIVFYAGGNDIAAGASVNEVVEGLTEFVGLVQQRCEVQRLTIISLLPHPAFGKKLPLIARLNAMVGEVWRNIPFTFVDVHGHMESLPTSELLSCFCKDKIHLSERGYKILAEAVRPQLI